MFCVESVTDSKTLSVLLQKLLCETYTVSGISTGTETAQSRLDMMQPMNLGVMQLLLDVLLSPKLHC